MFRSLSVLFVLAAAAPVFAQGAQDGPAVPPAPRVIGGQDGLAIESGNGDYRLQIGLLVHGDGRFAAGEDAAAVADTFGVRRLRPYLRGRLLRRFEFYFNPDFAGGTLVVQDAYVDTIFAPAFRIRAGKGKTPFGMERLHSASNILFLERAFPTALVPNRDVGVQVLGDISGGIVSYLAGVMNGVADGASGELDANDSKDVSGRLVFRPFTRRTASALRGLGLAISGSAGRQAGAAALPTFRTQTMQQTYFTYGAGAVAAGTRTRYSPQLFFFRRQLGGWFEYVHTEMPITRAGVTGDVAHDAWQVAGSWVLTGEAATDAGVGVRPTAIFDPSTGHWGAFQVAARYHQLEVGQSAVALGLAAADASRTAQAWTVGLNWYPSGNLRYTVNFERTVFDRNRAGARAAENGIAFRTQLNF
jgi:phosphate-selective porin OprO/OprP